jgi:hypothetical protein
MSNSPPRTSLKKATKLLIYDANVPRWNVTAPIFVEQVLQCDPKECLRKVRSWKELVSELRKYETIDQLVLYFHGFKGGLIIGGDGKELREVVRLFARGRRPKVNKQIDFEACRVAEGPDHLAAFARIFRAPTIRAYNYFYVDSILPVNVEKTDNSESLRRKLAQYRDYLMPGTIDRLAKKKGKQKAVLEWFRIDRSRAKLPLPPRPTEFDTRSRTFKRRNDAFRRVVSNEDDLRRLINDYRSPAMQFEYVIIAIPPK